MAVGLAALKNFFPRRWRTTWRGPTSAARRSATRRAHVDVSPRPGRADVAAQVFARALDERTVCARGSAPPCARWSTGETILLPAVLGLREAREVWDEVQEEGGAPVAKVATSPALRARHAPQHRARGAVRAAGGRIRLGPEVVGCRARTGASPPCGAAPRAPAARG